MNTKSNTSNITSAFNTNNGFSIKMTEMERFRLEKQQKLEEMKLKVQKLREERMAKHAERVKLLKEIHTKTVTDHKILKTNENGVSQNSTFKTNNRMSMLPPKKPMQNENKVKNMPTNKLKEINIIDDSNKKRIAEIKPMPKNMANHTAKNPINVSQDKNKKPDNFVKPRMSLAPSNVNGANDRNKKIDTSVKSRMSFAPSDMNGTNDKNKIFVKSRMSFAPSSLNGTNDKNKKVDNLVKSRMSFAPLNTNGTKDKNKNVLKSRMSFAPSNMNGVNDKNVPDINSKKKFSIATANRLAQPKQFNHPPAEHIKPTKSLIPTKTIKDSKKILVENKPKELRRSLSTIHFHRVDNATKEKKMSRAHSMGNIKRIHGPSKIDEVSLNKNIALPVKSENKKMVKFLTPSRKSNTPNMFLNTPNPSELRRRLNDWLQKRGKSLSQYSHLHCFGIHEAMKTQSHLSTIHDEENKENEEVSDDDSITENKTGKIINMAEGWQNTGAEKADFLKNNSEENPSNEENVNLESAVTENLDHIMIDALNDLRKLILEGYSWNQCEEWLRTIVRNCSEDITNQAAYWECRAALEEKRGDFSEAVECYNKAIQQGAKPSTVDSSLDHLLDKFMKLNLDPKTQSKTVKPDKKLLDVKNVFKSTLIKFAIQQKEQRESMDNEHNMKKFTATPVRRSTRLSVYNANYEKTQLIQFSSTVDENNKTEMLSVDEKQNLPNSTVKSSARKHLVQICSTLTNIENDSKQSLVFIPNKALNFD